MPTIDRCEFWLGKPAGAADAAAVLYAQPGRLLALGSHPLRRRETLTLPSSLDVVLVDTRRERLSHSSNEAVARWARELAEFGARALKTAAAALGVSLLRSLIDDERVFERLAAIDDERVRGVAVYGVAEAARVREYVAACAAVDDARVLELVAAAHDGDRAYVDTRRSPFVPTPWASSTAAAAWTPAALRERQAAVDAIVDATAAARERTRLLTALPGRFERSLPDIDDIVDRLRQRFKGAAQARIAGAGLGGVLTVHCRARVTDEVRRFFDAADVGCRVLDVGLRGWGVMEHVLL